MRRKTASGPATDQSAPIIEAAVRLAARKPWSEVSLGAVAAEAGLPVGQVYAQFRCPEEILEAVMEKVDEAMLDSRPDLTASVKDRLFDVLMRRFDALSAYKDAMVPTAERLRKGRPDAFLVALTSLPRYRRSLRLALEAAGVPTIGLSGLARVKLLGLVLLRPIGTWLEDTSSDQAKTMAALDKALTRFSMCCRERGPAVDPIVPDVDPITVG